MLKIGVQSGGWYKDEDPRGSLAYIKDCGFNAVDFNMDYYVSPRKLNKEGMTQTFFDQSAEEILAHFTPLKEACAETDVEISQMHAPFPLYFENNDALNAYLLTVLDKCFAVCEYIRCPAIVVHPVGGSSRAEEWQNNLAFYRGLIPLIKKYKGVTVCLENLYTVRPGRHEEGKFANADDAVKMVDLLNEEAGGTYFGFCLDVGHAVLTCRSVRDFITTLGHRLTILHIHDTNGVEDLHMLPYAYLVNGKSHVCDWDGFVAGLTEIGYRGTLAFETFRIFSAFPEEVHTEVLRLIAAIGRTWSSKILSGDK